MTHHLNNLSQKTEINIPLIINTFKNYGRQTIPRGVYTVYIHGTPHDILSPLMFGRDLHMSVWPIHSSMRLRVSHLVVPRRVYDRLSPIPSPS